MSTGTQPGAKMHADVAEYYRPIAAMAVVSLVLGLLSILAFAHSAFWLIPPIALIVSGRTSWRLEQAKREYAGQLIAKLAVAISLICLFCAPTKQLMERFILSREARSFADDFLDQILAHRVKQAFVLSIGPWKRPADRGPEGSDQVIIRNGVDYRKFLSEPLVQTLIGKASDAQVTYFGVEAFGYETGFYTVILRYRIQVAGKAYQVFLAVKGGVATAGEWRGRQWYVAKSSLEEVQPAAASSPDSKTILEDIQRQAADQ